MAGLCHSRRPASQRFTARRAPIAIAPTVSQAVPGVGSPFMTPRRDLDISQLTHSGDADPTVRQELTACWIAVTNAGGAAGFPFPPVNASHVAPAVDALAARLDPRRSRILLARINGALAGWVALSRDSSPLIAHWGTVNHLQTQLAYRNEGVGSALMHRLREVARDEMGLE